MAAIHHVCQWCAQPFAASRSDARYCGPAHRVSAFRDRRLQADRASTAEALSSLDTVRAAVADLLGHAPAAPAASKRTTAADPRPELATAVDAALIDAQKALLRRAAPTTSS